MPSTREVHSGIVSSVINHSISGALRDGLRNLTIRMTRKKKRNNPTGEITTRVKMRRKRVRPELLLGN
jgi:hypothetical protein